MESAIESLVGYITLALSIAVFIPGFDARYRVERENSN
jgi:hypothetical protein